MTFCRGTTHRLVRTTVWRYQTGLMASQNVTGGRGSGGGEWFEMVREKVEKWWGRRWKRFEMVRDVMETDISKFGRNGWRWRDVEKSGWWWGDPVESYVYLLSRNSYFFSLVEWICIPQLIVPLKLNGFRQNQAFSSNVNERTINNFNHRARVNLVSMTIGSGPLCPCK